MPGGHAERPTCSRPCGVEYRHRNGGYPDRARSCAIFPRDCDTCGKPFIGRSSRAMTCGFGGCKAVRLRQAIALRYHADPEFHARVLSAVHNRRADRLGVGRISSPRDLIGYLTERDRGICGICHDPVTDATGPMRPSPDHVIPLARGGGHSLENLQLSHLDCNLRKGASVPA
jgi:HNH endonuclease